MTLLLRGFTPGRLNVSLRKSSTRHRFPFRLSVLLTVCTLALLLATAGGLAQKNRKPTGPTRNISGGSERPTNGNNRVTRSSNKSGRILNRTTSGSNVQDPITGQTVGVPSVGETGIQRTTAEIMQAQQVAAPSSRPHLATERELPNRENRPQDPNSPLAASWPDAGPAAPGNAVNVSQAPAAPQPLSTTFNAVTGPTETGAFPPDTMGAVGPSQFFLFVNGRLRTFNKATGTADAAINADPDVFFASVMTPLTGGVTINFTSDPQVRYDRLTGRWILTIIDVPSTSAGSIGDTPNRILIAVSDAASNGVISGGTVWTFFFVQQDTVGGPSTGEFLDYESLGVDANALYVGGNMFGAVSGTFIGCSGFVIRKSSVLSGGPVVTTAFRNMALGAGEGPESPRGVDNYDP